MDQAMRARGSPRLAGPVGVARSTPQTTITRDDTWKKTFHLKLAHDLTLWSRLCWVLHHDMSKSFVKQEVVQKHIQYGLVLADVASQAELTFVKLTADTCACLMHKSLRSILDQQVKVKRCISHDLTYEYLKLSGLGTPAVLSVNEFHKRLDGAQPRDHVRQVLATMHRTQRYTTDGSDISNQLRNSIHEEEELVNL
uniref:Uncharacterized protein n=1 Tax=Timema tahoe TaxID=61484 RepID=A0A7R9IDY3_9NEOP|nr:unnamed protein product [Timema tahoe]